MKGLRVLALGCLVALGACGGSMQSPLLREGREIFRAGACTVCHGGDGTGAVGPALTDVALTFPACADHIEWVSLGSEGWKAIHGDTYGATDREVGGGMAAFGETLTDAEIRTVVAYERIEFGHLDEAEVAADCGV